MQRVLTEIITPFDNCESIDINSLIELIRFQLGHKCGIVLFGTTGECSTLTHNEREIIMDQIVKIFSSNLDDFVINIVGENTSECIYNINFAKEKGFSRFILTSPYLNKLSQIEMQKYFYEICDNFKELKFIIYIFSDRKNGNLLPKTIYNINIQCPNVFAIKESSKDLSDMIQIKIMCPSLKLYCSYDELVIPAMSIGAYGLISILSNYTPKTFNLITDYCYNNKYKEANLLYKEINDLIKLSFTETNPISIKYILHKSGLISLDEVRSPLVKSQNKENQIKLSFCMSKLCKYYLINIGN